MATGSGRAAIFHLHLTRDRKNRPRSWMTSFPACHLGSKMATPEMTSGGRRDAREDVLQTSAPSMSPVEV